MSQSASIRSVNALHDKLTQMFTRILDGYLEAGEKIEAHMQAQASEEAVSELLAVLEGPSPAMLAVIAKFLKDNDVTATPETVEGLTDQQKRLEERRKNRPSLTDLKKLPVEGIA